MTGKSYRRKTGLIMLTMSLIMFSPVFMHLIGFRIPLFENLGLSKGDFAIWYVWIIAATMTISYIVHTFKAIPFVYKMQQEISLFKLIGLLAIIGGILEEIVFRRWLMDLLHSHSYNVIFQIIISGIAFGLSHAIWGLFAKNKQFLKGAFISTSLLGFAYAIIYLISKRNIGPCIVSHSLINIIIEPWLLLSAISNKLGIKNNQKQG